MWYVKYCSNNHVEMLPETKDALNKEFSNPKFYSQSIVRFKEIMMRVDQALGVRSKFEMCNLRS